MSNIETGRHLDQLKCHTIGVYDTGMFVTMDITAQGGNMICYFPINTESTFPLLSFAHGYGGGGLMINSYTSMLQQLASRGFVVCAYTDCYPWCPGNWPKSQLDVITTARKLAKSDANEDFRRVMAVPTTPYNPVDIDIETHTLPIQKESKVGVFVHSSGGISTLLSAYTDPAEEYSIGAAVTYDGSDAAAFANEYYPNVNLDLSNVASIPIFMSV